MRYEVRIIELATNKLVNSLTITGKHRDAFKAGCDYVKNNPSISFYVKEVSQPTRGISK